ncbi:hypothetical protein QTP86_014210 [Hemibagrus guttatus]|nr:hypothetical protein QTP86_014210 [Hemibagrus guttatus]
MEEDSNTNLMEPDSTDSSSSNGTDLKQECENYDQYFLGVSLLPAVLIVLLLSFIQQREKIYSFERRFLCLRGRFGVVVPVDFSSTLENRWSYAFAFGAVTHHMVNLIIGISNPLPFTLPPYLKVFVYMAAALKVGVACMPLFSCLSTPHQLLGGVLGLLYSLFWFTMSMYELVWCNDSTVDKGGLRDYLLAHEWLLDLPHLLCLGFLVCRFGFQTVKDILIRLKKHNKQEEVQKEQYKYVQRLLKRPAERSVEKSWFQRKVYEWDPYFKFPNRIIATVVLCFFSLYLMVLIEQVSISFSFSLLDKGNEFFSLLFDQSDFSNHLNYFKYTWYVSSACATFLSVIHISRVLVCYRKHIKSMWAGKKIYLPRKYKPNPTASLGGLLKYPGYQIAFTLWGYLIAHLAMFVGGLVFVYMVISPIRTYGFLHWLTDLIIVLYVAANFFVVLAVMALQRMFLHMFFLQDKISSTDKDKPLALNNRKVFHNVNYFLFFFNVILGLMSCMMRLLKSSAVGLMLLSCIERAIMPQGFEILDKSYCTWLGMIITDHHHSNPVLLSFCHLMLHHTPRRVRAEEPPLLKSERPGRERALTRWFLMYTLVRNPKLILMRKQAVQSKTDTEFAFAWASQNVSSAPVNETILMHNCKTFENFFVPWSMLPSVFIILLLSFMERRKELCEYERRFPCLNGRFNFVIPVDFTGKKQNRWSYGFAFGAVTPFMINLMLNSTNLLNFPNYLKVLEVVIVALIVSIACLPLFTCLSTPHRLFGGVLGLIYSLSWSVEKSWFQRKVYEWDPYFKFPNRIIATVVLCFLGLYMVITTEQTITSYYISDMEESSLTYLTLFFEEATVHTQLNYITNTWYITTACATLSSLVHISHVLVYYRTHIKSLRAGERKYFPKMYKLNSVDGVVGFLKYPGYQIAFSVWGYVIVHIAMFMIGLMFVCLVILPIQIFGILLWLKWVAMSLANFLTLIGLMRLQCILGQIFFLQDKTSPTEKMKPLAIKNRKAFHNFNYFFFFFNMVLGLMNCLLRIIKSLAVGVMLVSRIERTIMPEGFETLDSSYCTWLGMIMADHHHSNPVLVCFCHLLLKHPSEDIQDEGYSRLHREPLEKNRVHIRWHLVYTLLRNPKLILLRKKHKQENDKDRELAYIWTVTNT